MSDPRSLMANSRVAHVSLKGEVSAPRYTEGDWLQVNAPLAPLFRSASSSALERQLLMGEPFLVIDEVDGRCFGQCGFNGFVGYVPSQQLGPGASPGHVVHVARTLAFAEPDLKTPDPVPLSLGSRVRVVNKTGRFAELDNGKFVPVDHLRDLDNPEHDPVSVAERLIGTPYLWGGNSGFGIDCSGLVQIALNASGLFCPGDSDQQLASLGEPLPSDTRPQRGDLMFWKGHVAWCADEETLVHANAGAMAVAREGFDAAVRRIAQQGDGPVIAHVRPTPPKLQERLVV
ncbi:MAG: NlpC/P60 family protein [Arenibacterium sp.]